MIWSSTRSRVRYDMADGPGHVLVCLLLRTSMRYIVDPVHLAFAMFSSLFLPLLTPLLFLPPSFLPPPFPSALSVPASHRIGRSPLLCSNQTLEPSRSQPSHPSSAVVSSLLHSNTFDETEWNSRRRRIRASQAVNPPELKRFKRSWTLRIA